MTIFELQKQTVSSTLKFSYAPSQWISIFPESSSPQTHNCEHDWLLLTGGILYLSSFAQNNVCEMLIVLLILWKYCFISLFYQKWSRLTHTACHWSFHLIFWQQLPFSLAFLYYRFFKVWIMFSIMYVLYLLDQPSIVQHEIISFKKKLQTILHWTVLQWNLCAHNYSFRMNYKK